MRFLLTGGGTAGHINPALAIAETIKRNIPDAEIAFVGTPNGMENRLVPKEGYPIYHVEVEGIRRSLSPRNIKALWLALVSPKKAEKIIKEYKPDCVIGTGGYVSWPILVAASKLGVATAVHESNAVPGVTVARLEKYVDRVYLNFEKTKDHLKQSEKHLVVGCPLRGGFVSEKKVEAYASLGLDKYKNYVLIYGGSLGADRINEAVLDYFSKFAYKHRDTFFTLGCGKRNYERLLPIYEGINAENRENTELKDYLYDMPKRMAAADVVISRSGAMTLSELALSRKCAVLIPSPNVTNNQQYKNAKVLSDKDAAVLLPETELSAEKLEEILSSLIQSCDARKVYEENIKAFAVEDANRRIFDDIMNLIKEKKK